MSDFVLNVHDIDETGKDYTFPVEPAWITREMAGCDVRPDPALPHGELAVHAQKNGNDFLVTGNVRSAFIAECHRCLEDTKIVVSSRVAALFTHGPASVRDDDDDQPDVEHFAGDRIVLDGLVRETLLLGIPMQPLCTPDCAGIPVPANVRPPEDFGEAQEGALQRALSKLSNKE